MTNTELIARLRSFEIDHKPHDWPAIQMRDVSALINEIEALQAEVPGLHGYSADAMRSAVLAEREACAKVCDEQAGEPECSERAKYCAEEIRSRSNADLSGRTRSA